MSSQYLPFEVLEKGKKKPSKYLAQLQVREIKMYEIVCPKDQEDVVMGLLKPNKLYGGAEKFEKPLRWFTKMLGLNKCSTKWKPNLLPNTEGMAIMALGTKDDKMNWEAKVNKDVFAQGHTPKENL